jgi:hypothetical protein
MARHVILFQIRPLPPTFVRVRHRPDAPLLVTGRRTSASQVSSSKGLELFFVDRMRQVTSDRTLLGVWSASRVSACASPADVNVRHR